LGQELFIGSNLIAHHLKILQAAQLVARHQSEGDRRRTYLRLIRETFVGLGVPQPERLEAKRVIFVCSANSARSQLAHALWRRVSLVAATSAGTHPAARIHAGANSVARRHGLTLAGRQPRELSDVLRESDLIVTVCDSAAEQLPAVPPIHWSIPDPVGVGTPLAFDAVYDELVDRISILSGQVSSPTN
jgi:protein-tyrosine-phosphatase